MTKKVLFVVTSHDQLGKTGHKTGSWVEEAVAPYYILRDKGIDVTLTTPKGGQVPWDPKSYDPSSSTPATERFFKDKATEERFANTVALSSVESADFDAIFYPGGHGPLWDLRENKDSLRLIAEFAKAEKPVAAVCHGPCVLIDAVGANGEPLVKGKKVTGFTNEEEDLVQLTDVVPVLVEDALKEKGGQFEKSAQAWAPHVVTDGFLITGQNPASSEGVAEALLTKL